MKVGAFNNIVFEVSSFKVLTFDKYSRSTKHRYTTHDILNHKQKLESVGNELTKIELHTKLNHFLGVDVATELAKMRALCENGVVDYLIIGNSVVGLFVIEELKETAEIFGGNGDLLAVEVNMSLVEYY